MFAKTCLILPNNFEGNPIWESYIQSAKKIIHDDYCFAEVKIAKQYIDSGYTLILMSVANSLRTNGVNQEIALSLLRIYNENLPFQLLSQPTFVRLVPNTNKKKKIDYIVENQIVLPIFSGVNFDWHSLYDGTEDLSSKIKYWSPAYLEFLLKAIQYKHDVPNLKVYSAFAKRKYCIGQFLFITSENLKSKADYKYKKILFEGEFAIDFSKVSKTKSLNDSGLFEKLPQGSKVVTHQELVDSMNLSNKKFLFYTVDPYSKFAYLYDFENGSFLGYIQSDYRQVFPLNWIIETTLKVYPQFERR